MTNAPEILPPPRGLEVQTILVGARRCLLFEFPVGASQPPPGLTEAEQEIVQGVLDGRTNRELAVSRGTLPTTIANQLRAVYKKLGISNRVEVLNLCASRSAERERP